MDNRKTDNRKDENAIRRGNNFGPDIEMPRTNEREWRETVEQVRNQEGQMVRPGGDGPGHMSEGSKGGHARAMRRSRRSGRAADEFGGARGLTK